MVGNDDTVPRTNNLGNAAQISPTSPGNWIDPTATSTLAVTVPDGLAPHIPTVLPGNTHSSILIGAWPSCRYDSELKSIKP